MSRYIDKALERAKTSRPPLRLVLPSDPSETECKILMSIQFHGALLESTGRRGDLDAFAQRLRYELQKIEEALS